MTEVTLLYEQPLLKACHFLPLMSSGNRSEQAGGVNNTAFCTHMDPLGAPAYVNSKLPAWPSPLWITSHLGWPVLQLYLNLTPKKPWLMIRGWHGGVEGLTFFLCNVTSHLSLKLSCLSSCRLCFFHIWATAVTYLPYTNPLLCVIILQIYSPFTAAYCTKPNHTPWVAFPIDLYISRFLNNLERNCGSLIGLFRRVSPQSQLISKLTDSMDWLETRWSKYISLEKDKNTVTVLGWYRVPWLARLVEFSATNNLTFYGEVKQQ